jgi:EPS-associated MarR family transcriptional regulator
MQVLAGRHGEQQAEIGFKVLRLVPQNLQMSTPQLTHKIGISIGSAYHVLAALVEKRFVKLGNFNKSLRKGQYAYLLTPKGMREKSLLTQDFIEQKREEFRLLQLEMTALEDEVGLSAAAPTSLTANK